MSFDFPSSGLTVGQIVIGPNGIQYRWDGTKWTAATNTPPLASITISDTAPVNPGVGNLWFDSTGLQTYIWYTDPTSSQWTPMMNQGALLADAPKDGSLYGRVNGAWSAALPISGGTLTGSLGITAAQPTLTLNKAAPTNVNAIVGQMSGLARWSINPGDNTGAESGGNNGSDFNIYSYNDNGTLLGNPLNITRFTGVAQFNAGSLALNGTQPYFIVNKTGTGVIAGMYGMHNWQNRWALLLGNNTTETGSNVGSDFSLTAFSDAGASLGNGLAIRRSDGLATFNGAGVTINTSNGGLGLSGAAASQRAIDFYTSGSDRWRIMANQNAESGSNAGSDFNIACFADNGAFLSTPLAIQRSTGNATFSGGIFCTQLEASGSNGILYLNKSSGTSNYSSMIAGSTSGLNRWALYLGDGGSETGSDAGSNFGLAAIHDNGSWNDWIITTNRANLVTNFAHPLALNNYSPNGNAPNGGYYVMTGWYQSGNWYNAAQASVYVSGSTGLLGYNNGNNVQWSTSGSDRRRKTNIKDTVLDAFDIIKRIPIHSVDYNPIKPSPDIVEPFAEPPIEHWPFSFIADEVGAVMPHATIRSVEENGKYHVGLHPQHLIAVLWKAVQQLSAEVEALKAGAPRV